MLLNDKCVAPSNVSIVRYVVEPFGSSEGQITLKLSPDVNLNQPTNTNVNATASTIANANYKLHVSYNTYRPETQKEANEVMVHNWIRTLSEPCWFCKYCNTKVKYDPYDKPNSYGCSLVL